VAEFCDFLGGATKCARAREYGIVPGGGLHRYAFEFHLRDIFNVTHGFERFLCGPGSTSKKSGPPRQADPTNAPDGILRGIPAVGEKGAGVLGHYENGELRCQLIESGDLFCLELFNGFEEDVANDGESFGADFVEGILRCVPVTVVHKIPDDIHGGNTALHKGVMVIFRG
jgi:hypothetical protein